MKKTIALLLLVGSSAFLSAQGTFTFNNNTATRITNSLTSAGASVNVAAYYSANTNVVASQDGSSLQIAANSLTNTLATGTFIGNTRFIPGIDGGIAIAMQVRAWSGAFTTYEAALAAALVDGTTLVGRSAVFYIPALGGGPGNIPTPAIFGAGRLNQFNVGPAVIPEPSSIALGVLGLGAIALFRRKK